VVSLSSAEAEYYSLVTGASHLLGDASLAKDWGVNLRLRVCMDATAGIAIASRRGLGRVRHVDTAFLWVQEKVTQGVFGIRKVGTQEMLADMLTKPLTGPRIHELMLRLGFEFREGRNPDAKGLQSVERERGTHFGRENGLSLGKVQWFRLDGED
jgi:hypothetical protein